MLLIARARKFFLYKNRANMSGDQRKRLDPRKEGGCAFLSVSNFDFEFEIRTSLFSALASGYDMREWGGGGREVLWQTEMNAFMSWAS